MDIGQQLESAFSAVVVGHDLMNGDLLVDALIRNLKCDAVAIRSSNLLQALGARQIDLVIVSADLNGKLGSGVVLAERVVSAHPKLPVVILLDQPTRTEIVRAFRSGVQGVFNRQESMGSLMDCIEHVRKGYIWVGRDETSLVLEMFRSIPAPITLTDATEAALTKRELEAVRIAATGKTNKAIASEMGLSEHTVKNYLFHSFEKLGVSSRVELLFYLTSLELSLDSVNEGRPAKLESHSDDYGV